MRYVLGKKTKATKNAFKEDDFDLEEFLRLPENFNSPKQGIIDHLTQEGFSQGDLNEEERAKAALDFLKERYAERKIKFNKKTIIKWLGSDYVREAYKTRDDLFALCMALDYDEAYSKSFIEKVFFERAFNFRKANECIWYYCLLNGYNYADVTDCINYYNNLPSKKTTDDLHTHFIYNVLTNTKDTSLDYLKSFLKDNQASFSGNSSSALTRAKELIIKAYTLSKDFNNKHRGTEKQRFKLEDVNAHGLIREITGFSFANYYMKERTEKKIKELEEKRKQAQKKAEEEGKPKPKIRVRSDYYSQLSIRKESAFLKSVSQNFPTWIVINHIQKGKIKTDLYLRKTIIMMHFFIYCNTCKEKKIKSDLKSYCNEIDDILEEAGLNTMYWRNPYDWLFLYSVNQAELYEETDSGLGFFADIMNQMVSQNDLE